MNLKKILIIFLLSNLLISCSSKELEVDIDAYINEGKQIFLNKKTLDYKENVFIIKKIKNINPKNIYNWSQKNLNSQNFIFYSNINLSKNSFKIINNKINNVIFHKGFFYFIDHKSNLSVYNEKLKLIKTFKIYKNNKNKNLKLIFSLAAYKNFLIISDNLGNIFSFNTKDFKKEWSLNLNVPFKSDIKVYNNSIYVINTNSKIFSINADNGKINWSYESASKVLKSKDLYKISIYKNKLIFSNDFAQIYCFDLENKKILWSFGLKTENFISPPKFFSSSELVVNDNSLYFSSNFGELYSVNIDNGLINWSKKISSINIPIVYDNFLILSENMRLFILNKNNGKILFSKNFKNLFSSQKDYRKFIIRDVLPADKGFYLFLDNASIVQINFDNLNNYVFIKKNNLNYRNYLIYNNKLVIVNENSLIFQR